MSRSRNEGLYLMLLVIAATGVVLAARVSVGRGATAASAVACVAFLLTLLAVTRAARCECAVPVGRLPLVIGLGILVIGSALHSARSAGLMEGPSFVGRFIPLESVPDVFLAAGSTGMALGFALWMNAMTIGAATAEKTAIELRSTLDDARVQLKERTLRLEQVMTVDALTGVMNRETFLTRMQETIQRDARTGHSVGFLMAEVHGVAAIQEQHGRMEADFALKEVAKAFKTSTRGTDFVGRVGDAVFAAVLGECSDIGPALDRVFLGMADGHKVGEDGRAVPVHVGAVHILHPSTETDLNTVFRVAEKALTSIRENPHSAVERVVLGSTPGQHIDRRHAG